MGITLITTLGTTTQMLHELQRAAGADDIDALDQQAAVAVSGVLFT